MGKVPGAAHRRSAGLASGRCGDGRAVVDAWNRSLPPFGSGGLGVGGWGGVLGKGVVLDGSEGFGRVGWCAGRGDGYGGGRVSGDVGCVVVADRGVRGRWSWVADAVVVAGSGAAGLSAQHHVAGARPVELGVPDFVVAAGEPVRCRSDPEAYFADGVRSRGALALCSGCSFLEACRAYAVERPALWGVWGGTTRMERVSLRRRPVS
ncbi:WhiB family transcriptional regulator [Streptomyces chartreusis]